MARKKRWWPTKIIDQLIWFANYPVALEKNKVRLEATLFEITQAQKDAAMFKYVHEYYAAVILYAKVVMTYLEGIINGKDQKDLGNFPVFNMAAVPPTVLAGMLFRTFKYILNLKSRKGYTDAIGKSLGIIGKDPTAFDKEKYIANGKAVAKDWGILISFKKGKNIHGMAIFCQRGDSKEFVEIFRANKNKWTDNRPNLKEGVPEVRTYYTRAFIDDVLIGWPSPPFKITWLSPPIPKEEKKEV